MRKHKTIPVVIAAAAAVLIGAGAYCGVFYDDCSFTVDTTMLGGVLPNVKSNINRFGGRFPEDPVINEEYDPYAFTEYIQLMECSGGESSRDLFADPDDFGVTDDYDFEPLLASCRGILKTGAKPLLKLGNVPAKLSQKSIAAAGSDSGVFGVNVYPPDDYGKYYAYIKAIAEALVDEFGLDEVKGWRFGVMTEYENHDWFHTADDDPEATKLAFFKLYDHTAQALIDVIGDDVFIGAHSMSCSEGFWDEAEFIRHCGEGTNYATGKKGSRLCYLAASYYESRPGKTGGVKPLPEIVSFFRETAESAGLGDLIFGVDEGRVLCGNASGSVDSQLYSRTVGDTWQAAFDARLIKQAFDSGLDYFSSWEYCSQPDNHGLPLITYHVAEKAAGYAGSRLAQVGKKRTGLI